MNRELKLSKRLDVIAGLVEEAKVVADVGTDHGYIPNYLVENGLAEMVYATDISADSLQKNVDMVKLRGNSERIISLVGDGLVPVEGRDVDTVIIAGMGGLLMMNILEKSRDFAKGVRRFILQPQSSTYELREYLYSHEYKIIREVMVEDSNKLYEVLLVEHGHMELETELHLKYGKNLLEDCDDVFLKFIKREYDNNVLILEKLSENSSEKSEAKIAELKLVQRELGDILNDCSGRSI